MVEVKPDVSVRPLREATSQRPIASCASLSVPSSGSPIR